MRKAGRDRRGLPRVPSSPDLGRARRATIWTAAGRYALAFLLVASATGGWWLYDWLAEGAPVVDAFYDPPDRLPPGHGRLVRWDDYLGRRSEEHTSELQSLMRISYAAFCL